MYNKIKTSGLSLIVVSTLSITSIGCGSSTSTVPSSEIETGTFIDAPVQGLSYSTTTQDGYTNANGEFKYIPGETIEFKLGNLSLGTAVGKSLITPYTLGDSNSTNPSAKTTNIAILLQSLDRNRNTAEVIDVSKLKEYNFTVLDFNVSTNDMRIKLNDLLATGNFASEYADGNITSISPTDANSAMENFVKYYNITRKYGIFTVLMNNKTINMNGEISTVTLANFNKLIANFPNIKTVDIINCNGSSDDEVNLILSKKVHDKGMNTHIVDNGEVASGGTDFFLAGNKRTIGTNVKIGVHSWASGKEGTSNYVEASKLHKDDESHDDYIQYYIDIGFTKDEAEDFYFFTLDASPANDIHYMTNDEIAKYNIVKP